MMLNDIKKIKPRGRSTYRPGTPAGGGGGGALPILPLLNLPIRLVLSLAFPNPIAPNIPGYGPAASFVMLPLLDLLPGAIARCRCSCKAAPALREGDLIEVMGEVPRVKLDRRFRSIRGCWGAPPAPATLGLLEGKVLVDNPEWGLAAREEDTERWVGVDSLPLS